MATASVGISAVLFAVSQLAGPENAFARAILAASLATQVFNLLAAILSPRETQFRLVFSLYMIVALIFPAMLQCARGEFPVFAKQYDPGDILGGAAIVAVFCATVQVGLGWADKRLASDSSTDTRETAVQLAPFKSLALIGILAVIALAVGAVLGFGSLLHRRADFLVEMDPFSAIRLYAGRFSGFYCFVLSAALFVKYPAKLPLLLPILACSFFIFMLLDFPINIARTLVFTYVVCFIFSFFRIRGAAAKSAFTILYSVSVAFLAPLLHLISRGARGSADSFNFLDEYSKFPDLDSFQSLINVKLWTDEVGVHWGHQLLSAIFVFVPRSIWHGKALATGMAAANYVGYSFTNVSAPLPAELYSDFGWAGVVGIGLLCGYGIVRLDKSVARAWAESSRMTLIALGVTAGFIGIVLRGSLIGVGPWVALGILMGFLVRRAEVRPSSQPFVEPPRRRSLREFGRVASLTPRSPFR